MKVVQVVDILKYGDATGNFVLAISQVLDDLGITNFIYTPKKDKEIKKLTKPIDELIRNKKEDIIIFHFTGFSRSIYRLIFKDNMKILLYHNITPAKFFKNWSLRSFFYCKAGRSQLSILPNIFDISVSESTYNCDELKKIGFSKCFLLPIVVDKDSLLNHSYDMDIINKYSDGFINIIFVGRIVPNKKIEDIIDIFGNYNRNFNSRSRLIIIGETTEITPYYDLLIKKVGTINLNNNVIFTGKISTEALLGWYRCANIFITMSEHEGFCIPIIESMVFGIPVIAYAAGAIPEVIGEGGILIKEKNKPAIAKTMHEVISDKQYLHDLKEKQNKNISRFSKQNFKENLENILKLIEEEDPKDYVQRRYIIKNIKTYILINILGFNMFFSLSSIIKESISLIKKKINLF